MSEGFRAVKLHTAEDYLPMRCDAFAFATCTTLEKNSELRAHKRSLFKECDRARTAFADMLAGMFGFIGQHLAQEGE